MKRHDDAPGWRKRSDRWPVMFGDVRVVDRVAASVASWPRLGFDGTVMNCHDDSQRSNRLAVTFGDPHESLTARRAYDSVPRLGFRRMVMTRHDDSQRIDGLAVTQRGGSRLTRIWAGLYTRPRMGTDSIQPSYRLPTTDYRLPNRATASRSAPVLTAAPLIRAAHSRACGGGPRRPQPPPVYINRRCRDFRREGHICARPRGCKMILKEPHARAA